MSNFIHNFGHLLDLNLLLDILSPAQDDGLYLLADLPDSCKPTSSHVQEAKTSLSWFPPVYNQHGHWNIFRSRLRGPTGKAEILRYRPFCSLQALQWLLPLLLSTSSPSSASSSATPSSSFSSKGPHVQLIIKSFIYPIKGASKTLMKTDILTDLWPKPLRRMCTPRSSCRPSGRTWKCPSSMFCSSQFYGLLTQSIRLGTIKKILKYQKYLKYLGWSWINHQLTR